MDPRDQKLLDKQMRRLIPAPPNDGVMAIALAAMLCAGLALGGVLFAGQGAPMQTASNDTPISSLNNAPPITR